jgi:hypothetical protein
MVSFFLNTVGSYGTSVRILASSFACRSFSFYFSSSFLRFLSSICFCKASFIAFCSSYLFFIMMVFSSRP